MDLEKKHGIVSIGLGLRSDKLKKKKKELYVVVNFVEDGSAKKRERERCNVSAVLEGLPTSLFFLL